jgi:hypothetical protein
MKSCKDLALSYFQAWQTKEWDKMRACLSKDFKVDAGQIHFHSLDAFIEFCKNGPGWSNIQLLDALFLENKAALLYEGLTPTGEKIRVGEFLEVAENKILRSKVAIALG